MERKTAILIQLCGLFWLTGSAQVYDAGFIKPMDLPFNLAGSFGEPRPDHFHSGIDIKTNEQEGYVVVAVGDGYVSRIRVSPYGYGKSVYITHPNGYTSVYGHLSGFNAKLENYVHRQHYLKQQSELDLYPTAGQFKVKRGDTIAFSGNTGGSGGPHLHFEIRDSKTEHALNPLDFYPKSYYVDTIPPQLNRVNMYQVYDCFYNHHADTYTLTQIDGANTTAAPIQLANDSLFCLSFEGFDKQDHSVNKNGIEKMEILRDGDTVFQYHIREVDFGNTRMCNAFVDYNELAFDRGYFYNGFRIRLNTLPIYAAGKDGFLSIQDGDTANIQVNAYDPAGNVSTVRLQVIRADREVAYDTVIPDDLIMKRIRADQPDSISTGNFSAYFSQQSFYDDLYLELADHEDRYTLYSQTQIIPLHRSAKISILSTDKKDRDKAFIVRLNQQSKETALKTTFDKTHFYAETRELGTFYLKYDSVKPDIRFEGADETGLRAIITDQLSGVSSYKAYIDEQWVNVYYDAKNDRITYTFDEYCPPGEHKWKLIVTDAAGNSAIFTQTFKR